MNVYYISSSTIPSRDANSVHVMRMCQAFASIGHKATLFAIKPASRRAVEDDYTHYGVEACFDIVKFPHPPVWGVGALVHASCVLGAVVRRSRPDLFYARYAYNLAAISFLGTPMILEVHEILPGRQILKTLRYLFHKKNFLRLVAISDSLASDLRRLFPELPPEKILVAHDGADAFSLAIQSIPETLPGRPEALRVGYAGHLYPGRGIEVIAALAGEFPDMDFHIVGGTDEDLTRWKHQVRHHNLYFHGFVPPGRVPHLCVRFDVLLAPYQEFVAAAGGKNTARWMSPLKIFEYMALGKPIICSDLPVLREILVDKVDSLLVPPDDIQAWVRALKALKNNPNLRQTLGKHARDRLLTHYTWDKRAAAVLQGLVPPDAGAG